MALVWLDKRYHSLDFHLKNLFGEKVYKLSIDGGFTCPNRDGTLGSRGCIFCSSGGSGDFAASRQLSVTAQIETAKKSISGKYTGSKFIAYFQAFTNTYAPVQQLKALYMEALSHPDVVALSIATRPDCLPRPVLELIEQLNRIKPVWIELGLQTIHEKTAQFIRRGYPLTVFEEALEQLSKRHIETIVHVILGLPGETREDCLATIRWLSQKSISGIKLQLLHVLKGTDLADIYEKTPFKILTMEEYIDMVIECLELLPPETVIHRLTGDGPKKLLMAPLWSGDKKRVFNTIQKQLKERNTWQGRLFEREEKYNDGCTDFI